MNRYIQKIRNLAKSNKYTNYYCNIIEKALLRKQDREYLKEVFGYVESHHIIPKCFKLGGEKDEENLVFLTAKEHFVVHLCATKMFESLFKSKMIFAFRQLQSTNKFQDRYMNARLYALIKPEIKLYVRLYLLDNVKYIHSSDDILINEYLLKGWTKEMTAEFKIGRVGNMKGRKHTEETKERMSFISKGRPSPLIGIKRNPEIGKKTSETRKKNKLEKPEEYILNCLALGKKQKEMYRLGFRKKLKGENNPMYGKEQSQEARKLISDRAKERWAIIKNDSISHEKAKELARIRSIKMWKDNKDLKERSSIYNSKASQKYGMNPQDFYNDRLKPLLYLGFLPTAMKRYNLIDFSKGSIKRLIKEFGTKEDIDQFNLNKKNGGGANRAYIKFQEEQYNRYFVFIKT